MEKTNILHPGDVILEVNGVNVMTAEDLMHQVIQSKSTIQFRIAPTSEADHAFKPQKVTLFSYKKYQSGVVYLIHRVLVTVLHESFISLRSH